ncbi:MAG TPA: hypothetical protein VJ998_02160 [Pseudomonadales bacterium]|nr:hypothetical protein [Pseudomonadales bacterium]
MKPAAVILDLLRTYARKGTSVRSIMATGQMFGFSENLMRVNLSRLVSRGIVENVKRGHYRLTDLTDPINDFVEAWRLGEARLRPWDRESWVLVHRASTTTDKGDWALDAAGFRQVRPGLWLRPDCLAREAGELLEDLGLESQSLVASGARIAPRWQTGWISCFDIDAMTNAYRQCREQLLQSAARLEVLPHEQALKESFRLGGKAVHILAKDPLIPAPLMDPSARTVLWQTMLDYDRRGREIWGRRGKDRPDMMPTPHLEVSI